MIHRIRSWTKAHALHLRCALTSHDYDVHFTNMGLASYPFSPPEWPWCERCGREMPSHSESRVWFYPPVRMVRRPRSIGLPFDRGHDEFARSTVVIGWPWSGRMIVAYRKCGDPECVRDAKQTREEYRAMALEDWTEARR